MTVPLTPAIELSSYQRDFVRDLHVAGVRFLILGGMAMRAHRFPRQTEDIDILLEASRASAERLLPVIVKRFRSKPEALTVEWLCMPDKRIPLPDKNASEIDILTSCGALEFSASYASRLDVAIEGGIVLPVLGIRELIYSKIVSADRNEHPGAVERDLHDLAALLGGWQQRRGGEHEG
jgi:hypothetical protein